MIFKTYSALLVASGIELEGRSAREAFDKLLDARDELVAECERRADDEFDPVEVERLWREISKRHGVGHLLRPEGKPRQDGLEDRMVRKREFDRRAADHWQRHFVDGETVHRGIVVQLAGRYFVPKGMERDDIVAAGLIGVMKADRTYDSTRGASFKTHAYRCSERAIRELIRRSTRHKHAPLTWALSLDAPIGDGLTFLDTPAAARGKLPPAENEDPAARVLHREQLAELAAGLSDFERSVLALHHEGLDAESIATELNCSIKSVYNALGRARKKAA